MTSVLHYSVAGLVSLILYVKVGKEAAWIFFLGFVALRIYRAIRFLSKGKSQVKLGADNKLERWEFHGSLFSFTADLTTMTAKLIIPKGRTYKHERYHSSSGKSVYGAIDIEVALRSLDLYTHDETETIHTSYSETAMGYRQDGSFGLGLAPRVLTTSGKTGNVNISFHFNNGSAKGEMVPGKENLNWSRDKDDGFISYAPESSISRRQANDFVARWKEIEAVLK